MRHILNSLGQELAEWSQKHQILNPWLAGNLHLRIEGEFASSAQRAGLVHDGHLARTQGLRV